MTFVGPRLVEAVGLAMLGSHSGLSWSGTCSGWLPRLPDIRLPTHRQRVSLVAENPQGSGRGQHQKPRLLGARPWGGDAGWAPLAPAI